MRLSQSALVVGAVALLLLPGQSAAKWSTSVSKDAMTGEKSCYAHSASTGPTERMGFPYNDVKAWIGIGSDGRSEWAYVGFSDSPNLTDTDIGDGYTKIRTRIKWDDQVENVTMIQMWGAEFLHFENDNVIIKRIAESSTVLLELNWFGEGKTYFQFSLGGSSAAIAKIRSACGS